MATGKNIKQFSAADIEKYHKGQLPAAEMHAMEKAAMDDPFLADALEGYGVPGVNAASDLADLEERLNRRTGSAKLVPIASKGNRNFNLLRAAVILVFVAGAALLIYQFGFNKKNEEIAQAKEATDTIKITTDSSASTSSTSTDTATPVTGGTTVSPSSAIKPLNNGDPAKPNNKPATIREDAPKIVSTERGLDIPSETDDKKATAPVVTSMPRSADERSATRGIVTPNKSIDKDLAKEEKIRAEKADRDAEDEFNRQVADKSAASRREMNQREQTNTFRGRVTDADNVGVPFANVTVQNDGTTYTDARGYFNLNHPDSVLNVQVRSIGFENANTQLRNSVPTNQVILKDNPGRAAEINTYANTESRRAVSKAKSVEPSPVDGWENYDTYLVNNIRLPAAISTQKTAGGNVEVSFSINKKGEPTDLKIEKSLCKDCDKEAMRLVKEGPKWTTEDKKVRVKVVVAF